MHILYLTHDVSDPATRKRVRVLRAGGATITLAGFRREAQALTEMEGCPVIDFGRTYNGRFGQRIGAVVRTILGLSRHRRLVATADVILARNLEMLAVGARAQALSTHRPPLVYECLDIHRLLLRDDSIGKGLRALEGWLSRRASLLITSSPAFVRAYFSTRSHVHLPTYLLENKMLVIEGDITPPVSSPPPAPPWRIGWFGALRCRESLAILCRLARENPGLVAVVIAGRPAYDQLPDFDAQVAHTPGVEFLGSYREEDLARLYGQVHFNWAIDMFEAGQNSSWLLPNRIYEGGRFAAVPLAAEGVETAAFLTRLGIGHCLSEPKYTALTAFLTGLTAEEYSALHAAVRAVDPSVWSMNRQACEGLVATLRTLGNAPSSPAPASLEQLAQTSVLVVIPCLNEAAHLAPLVEQLLRDAPPCPLQLVIADGGSTDGTVAIALQLAAQHPHVHYLHNPARIQSAAMNLAVSTYGAHAKYLIRIDAHAHYPAHFCQTLLREAITHAADSVVVRMHTVGQPGFQEAVAAAQNSKLGNGGSAHRHAGGAGRWVDHGHHALMRMAAYKAVHGYDETFTHNEDAELDVRLRRAGYRIWLTGATMLDYVPRATPGALFRQYRAYGRGRLRTLQKHRLMPKLRQLLPVVVAPAAVLALGAPLLPIVALPFAMWAALCLGYGAALAYRARRAPLLLSGPAAMLMHGGWSLGFWQELLRRHA